jgi:hypothetical protein
MKGPVFRPLPAGTAVSEMGGVTMHCPHGEFALKHLGGNAWGTSCQACDPNGDRVAVLRNSPEADAIVEKHSPPDDVG